MIDDHELRSLFKAESAEHLQRLEAGLLRLEKAPTDQATLEEVFREAHSLKGASRMLGVTQVERLAHHLEDTLGAAKRGKTTLSPEMIDHLCQQLDIINQLVHEAVAEGSGSEVSSAAGETRHRASTAVDIVGQPAGPTPSVEPNAAPDHPDALRETTDAGDEDDAAPVLSASPSTLAMTPEAMPLPSSISESGPYRIETIRVAPSKLDALMRQAGELTVSKIRIASRLTEIEQLTSMWDEWSRDVLARRFLLNELERSPHQGAIRHITTHFEREQHRCERIGTLVNHLRDAAYEDLARLDYVAAELEEGVRTIRLLPLATIFNFIPRLVRDLARLQAKDVQVVIDGAETTADKRLLEEVKDPLMHLIHNAIDHGLETPEERERQGKPRAGTIRVRAYQTGVNLVIEVGDDGRGLDLEAVQRIALQRRLYREEELAAMTPGQVQSLIFVSGFSTSPIVTDLSGRGVGLDVVRTNVERLKGSIQVESTPGIGCLFRLRFPITLATTRVLIVAVDRRTYAIPIEYVHMTRLVAPQEIFTMEGRDTMVLEGQPVSLVALSDLLGVRTQTASEPTRKPKPDDVKAPRPCIILTLGVERVGLLVDALVDEQEVVVKPHGPILKRVRNVSGATILGTGEVGIVLNALDLLASVRQGMVRRPAVASGPEAERRYTILLAEDSITTRTQMKRILESAGYEVVTAVDGLDALNKLSNRRCDALVSDIQMPHMDGLTLTEKIRQDSAYNELPIILVTSLATEEDKRRGLDVGANAYMTKPTFDQKLLLDTLRRLL